MKSIKSTMVGRAIHHAIAAICAIHAAASAASAQFEFPDLPDAFELFGGAATAPLDDPTKAKIEDAIAQIRTVDEELADELEEALNDDQIFELTEPLSSTGEGSNGKFDAGRIAIRLKDRAPAGAGTPQFTPRKWGEVLLNLKHEALHRKRAREQEQWSDKLALGTLDNPSEGTKAGNAEHASVHRQAAECWCLLAVNISGRLGEIEPDPPLPDGVTKELLCAQYRVALNNYEKYQLASLPDDAPQEDKLEITLWVFSKLRPSSVMEDECHCEAEEETDGAPNGNPF